MPITKTEPQRLYLRTPDYAIRTHNKEAVPYLAVRIPRRNPFLQLFVCLALLCATAISQEKAAPATNMPPYRNPALAIDDRVADLLSRMTLEEKVEQLTGGGEDR